jgi:hypothetical protein
MRGSTWFAGLPLLLLATSSAWAQGPAPPPPMGPGGPGGPGGPANAPGAATTSPDEQATRSQLDRAESEDAGRKFEIFWLRGEIGGAYINMTQLSNDTLQVEKTSAGGPMFAFAAGVRFVVLVMGARLRHNALSSFNMWQLNGEVGVKLPILDFDFSITGHGGYSFVGRLGDAGVATSSSVPTNADKVEIRGFNLGIEAALDYYVSPTFSVGAGLFSDLLFLNRPPVEVPSTFTPAQRAQIANDPLYQRSGTSAGLQLGGGLRLGLHFGL